METNQVFRVTDGYFCTNEGDVYAENFCGVEGWIHPVSKVPDAQGYLSVYINCEPKSLSHVIWETIYGEKIPEGMEIDHIDGNNQNNRIENLRCVSHKENMNNPNTKKKISESLKRKMSEDKDYSDWVYARLDIMNGSQELKERTITAIKENLSKGTWQYNMSGELVKVWKSRSDVERELGYGHSRVSSSSLRGLLAYGFIWSDKELSKEELDDIFNKIAKKEEEYRHELSERAKRIFKRKDKIVYRYDTNTRSLICCYRNTADAGKAIGLSKSLISACCLGKITHIRGDVFSYTKLSDNELEERILNIEKDNVSKKKNLAEGIIKRSAKLKKKIDQYTIDGEYVKTWESAMDAARELEIDNSAIGKCCKGKYKSVGGFIWRFA